MDCKTARLLCEVRGDRDGELPPEDAASLQRHIESCPECQNRLTVETKFDTAIAKAMRAVPVPPALKARILDRLATQRGAFYRRRFFYAAAAAACVLVAVGILTWKPTQITPFDVQKVATETKFDQARRVDDWFVSQGIPYQAPAPFDPRLLAFHGTMPIQGKQVPTLEYQGFDPATSTAVFARVYVIREGEFDLKSLPETFSGSLANGLQARVFRDREQPDKLAYVVVYSGTSLDPFLTKFSST